MIENEMKIRPVRCSPLFLSGCKTPVRTNPQDNYPLTGCMERHELW